MKLYTRGPDNEAIPVDTHDHRPPRGLWCDSKALTAPEGPGLNPEDVLKRLDNLTYRVEKLEEEIRLLRNSRRCAHQVNPNTTGMDR